MSKQTKARVAGEIPEIPYPDCRPGDPNAKRLSVDIPVEVHTRIRNMCPFRGFWKLFLSRAVHQFDKAAQQNNLTTLTYPLSQDACFALIEAITEVGNFNDSLFLIELNELIKKHKPIIP